MTGTGGTTGGVWSKLAGRGTGHVNTEGVRSGVALDVGVGPGPDAGAAPGAGAATTLAAAAVQALTGGAAARLAGLTPAGCEAIIHLTITDEYPYAQAFVVIEARPRGA